VYRNQYIISSIQLKNPLQLNHSFFGGLNLYVHSSLPVHVAKGSASEILLLGFIIDPFHPGKDDASILNDLIESVDSKEYFFKSIQLLSGRYVILYKNKNNFLAANDACSLRQIYYTFMDGENIITSSQRLFLDSFNLKLEMSTEKMKFIDLKEFQGINESSWYGEEGVDDRLRKILPNHYLDIKIREVKRIPVFFKTLVGEPEILEYVASLLKGSIDAITRRYDVIQALTAGWDSRNLLAAAKESRDKIKFFVFDIGDVGTKSPDVWVPENLSTRLRLNFEVWKPDPLRMDFREIFIREHVVPRMAKAAQIQFVYDRFRDKNVIRVSGVAGAFFKSVYGYTRKNITPEMLNYFTFYGGKSEYIRKEVLKWYDNSVIYSSNNGIQLLDLFYWEQKGGNWGSLYPLEQDIAIEEFCPHSNRNMLISLLRMPAEKRASPNCYFIKKLIQNLWPETLSEPINPASFKKKVIKNIKRFPWIRYPVLKIKNAIQIF